MNAYNNLYLDKNNRWRFISNNRLAPNPFNKRCEFDGCDKLIRNKKHNVCADHIDWTKTAHGSSILLNDDVCFISENYLQFSDQDLADLLCKKIHHKIHTKQSLLLAIRHHRRKYLIHRYNKKFYYKTIKAQYRKTHIICEICSWSEAEIDIHHIWQLKDFDDEVNYHKIENLISLCPNHHRIVEKMRQTNKKEYFSYIKKYKNDI